MKILIVEDEPQLSGSIATYLAHEHYRCETAANFKDAQNKIIDSAYDCVMVDIGLPGGSGLELIKLIKELKRNDGIIVISANSALNDKLMGLNLGADDYLAKPFYLSELSARLNSLIRRRNFQGSNIFNCGPLQVDVDTKNVKVHDRSLLLSQKELDLLLFLVSNKNRTVSKSAIAEHLSQDESGYYRGYDVIYSHMKNLKKKLAEAGSGDYIKTFYGVGYKFECDETAG